jgi:transcriptional regulator with XRE-family HTH domain
MRDEGFDVGARLRAARHLAGFRHQRDLAQAIDQAGLGERTLRAIELGSRHATERDFRAIADACGLPLEWFTADFSRLAEISDPPREVLRAEREKVSARSAARSEGKPEATRPPRLEAPAP